VTSANFWIAKSFLIENKYDEAEPYLKSEIDRDINSEGENNRNQNAGNCFYNKSHSFHDNPPNKVILRSFGNIASLILNNFFYIKFSG